MMDTDKNDEKDYRMKNVESENKKQLQNSIYSFDNSSKQSKGKLIRLLSPGEDTQLHPLVYFISHSIFQIEITTMEDKLDSSIRSLSRLSFTQLTHRTSIAPKVPGELKQRLEGRFTLTDILDLQTIHEELTDRLSTDRSVISLAQLRTLRALKINALKQMSEEDCMKRYAKDPFFRKKVQSQIRSLSKSVSMIQLPKSIQEDRPALIQKTVKFIQQDRDITFRKIKENQCEESMISKHKLEQVIKATNIKIRSNKENVK